MILRSFAVQVIILSWPGDHWKPVFKFRHQPEKVADGRSITGRFRFLEESTAFEWLPAGSKGPTSSSGRTLLSPPHASTAAAR